MSKDNSDYKKSLHQDDHKVNLTDNTKLSGTIPSTKGNSEKQAASSKKKHKK